MFTGFFQLGNHVPLFFQTHNANGTPVVPDDCPLVAVYQASVPGSGYSGIKKLEVRMPPVDRHGVTAAFLLPVFLSSTYSAGDYVVRYSYLLSAFPFIEEDNFTIVAGGDTDGTGISMAWYDKPHGKFLVRQMNGGTLVEGRNPRL